MAHRKEDNAMEQDNKTMSAAELIRYIEDNNLELQMLDILLFNDCGFDFVPIYKPRITVDNNKKCCFIGYSIVDCDDINVLNSDYQMSSFDMPIGEQSKKWNRYINHPEHLHAYMVRYDNLLKCEFIYSRSSDASAQVRNIVFEDFIEYSGISSVKEFSKAARKAAKERNSRDRHVLVAKKRGEDNYQIVEDTRYTKLDVEYMNYIGLLFDEQVLNSIIQNGEEIDRLTRFYLARLVDTENKIFQNRYIYRDITPFVSKSSVLFFMEIILPAKVKTSLKQNFSIVDAEDQISNILYQIALNINANILFAATGYAYDSGIRMLEPAMICAKAHASAEWHSTEFIVGDLQDYHPDEKQKGMNRKTAERTNWLKDCHVLDHLYTCPDSFYHGKFYYISNGRISYVIVGSSNITESAYTKNRELDVMFRFERGEDGKPCEQEQMFLDWYADLKEKCVEIPRLDETLFSSNLLIDEAGNSSSPSILKKLTSEEEKDRYRFLESLCPSSVDEKMLYKKKEFKAFKGYIAFFYPENNITVLESFQYGNSCFVFGTTDEERIRMALARKSKEQVKQSDIYISNVNHDENYQSELRQIFGK